MDGEVAQLALEVTHRGESLQLLGGVHSVGYQFAKENLVVAIQEFFDDGEYVFSGYPNVSFLHISYVVLMIIHFSLFS